jgi:hydroxyacylglutathione hydrolase
LRRLFSVVLIFFFLAASGFKSLTGKATDLDKQKWIHGSEDCKSNHDPLIQVVAYDARTWILRQNKCIHYEAPFIFLFTGNEHSLLVDTGATTDEKFFPLRHVVDSILTANGSNNKKLIVAHTHSHGDHVAADEQFMTRINTEVFGLNWDAIQKHFGFDEMNSTSTIELGNRLVHVLSIPGHHQTSLAFYDPQTNLMFTGDTFYPGRLYVLDWPSFKKSVKSILRLAEEKKVTQFIGNHIEMTNQNGIDYPTGSIYQPHEHILPLTMEQLKELDRALDRLGDLPKYEVHHHFIIYPK